MSKSSINKQVYEQYVDATAALFMEHYALALEDAVLAEKCALMPVSESLDRRCMDTIRKACAKQRRREILKGTGMLLKSAAVILVALLSLSSVLFMTVEAFRVPVINFFIEQGDGFWAITGKNADDPIDANTDREFDPNNPLAGLLPEGYELLFSNGTEIQGRIVYQNEQGDKLYYYSSNGSIDMTVDAEEARILKRTRISHFDCVLMSKGAFAQVVLVDTTEDTSYLLYADAMDEDTILLLATNLVNNLSK